MQTHFMNRPRARSAAGRPADRSSARSPTTAFRGSSARPAAKKRGTCFDQQEYVDQIFMNSDTTIGVLSGIPYSLGADGTGTGGFAALSNEDVIAGAKELEAKFPNRMLTHCMVMPNDRLDLQLAMMERNAGTYDNWKTYPPWSPNAGQRLLARPGRRPADDPEGARPQHADLLRVTRASRSTASARRTPTRRTLAQRP